MNKFKKNNKGFSLVELIVVIAIMAILVGVAVPVYSHFIDKANKNKDIQLVDEIKRAVTITAAADNWAKDNPAGYGTIIITKDGITVVENLPLTNALTDALSKTNLIGSKRSYDKWDELASLGNGNAVIVAGSNFGSQAAATDLLKDVQNLTNDMQNVLADPAWQEALLGTGFGAWLDSEGISSSDSQTVANAATLYVAKDTTKNGVDEAAFLNAWMAGPIGAIGESAGYFTAPEVGLSGTAALAAVYARAEAAINYVCAQTPTDVITEENANSVLDQEDRANASNYIGMHKLRYAFTKQKVVVNGSEAKDIVTAYNSMQTIVNNVNNYLTSNASTAGAAFAAYISSENSENRKKDGKAYLALMNQVASSEDKVKEIGLDKAGLYNSPELTGYVQSYINVSELMSQTSGGASDKDIVITFTFDANGNVVSYAYPIDY